MDTIDFPALYRLQDQVLDIVFSVQSAFYLTGGTCLHRFYHEQRYSDDLDLFSNDNQLFRDDVRLIRQALAHVALPFNVVVDSRDFVRFLVADTLKVDLVNDRVYRVGRSVRFGGNLVLDNIDNIGANKICALLGRDDPKDVFVLYTIFELRAGIGPQFFPPLKKNVLSIWRPCVSGWKAFLFHSSVCCT